jgi:oxygen-dependent protoporphyrinogen oxidase
LSRSGHRVAVVGAGLAGLAAAWRLAAAGQRVIVLERAARAGGRAAASSQRGQAVDPIAARISSADAQLLALVREAGLARELLPLRPQVAAQLDGARLVPVGGTGPLDVARLPGVRPLDALRLVRLARLLRRYRRHLDPARPERAEPLDDRSLRDFGELYFGPSAVASWIEPWLAEQAPLDEREASRAAFLLRLAAEQGAEAGTLREPAGLLAEVLAARLGVRTGCTALRIEASASGALRIAAAGPSGAEALEADAVVLALPAPEAARVGAPLLASAEREQLAAVRYDPALTWSGTAHHIPVSVATRVRIPRRAGAPFSALVLEPRRAPIAAVPAGRVLAIARPPWSAAWLAAPDDAVAKEAGAELARWLPGAAVPDEAGRVHRFEQAWPRFEVGRYRALARFRAVGEDRRRAGRRLYFAGDFLAAPTLEGAVGSGLRAAADLLADLA